MWVSSFAVFVVWEGSIQFCNYQKQTFHNTEKRICIRTGLGISLLCDPGAEITLKLNLFEDVRTGDWIYQTAGQREREREREMGRDYLWLDYKSGSDYFPCADPPACMQAKARISWCVMIVPLRIYEYYLFTREINASCFNDFCFISVSCLTVQLQIEQRRNNTEKECSGFLLLKMKNTIETLISRRLHQLNLSPAAHIWLAQINPIS